MITFDSIHETYVTFNADEGLEAGSVCKITGDSAVGACADGEEFCGVARQVRGGLAGVVLGGFCRLAYSGTAPTCGMTALCADANGGVKVGGDKEYLVVQVDESEQTIGVFL